MIGKIALSHSESAGLELFRKHCASCHTEPLMTDYQFHNNGLDTQFKDVGRYRISQNSIDIGRFKTPSLRNIALTSPYMHDGRFTSLESVIHHYSHHILPSASLSNELSDKVGGFQLTNIEKKNLIDFLHTLSDDEFINDKRLVP
jgi:cytochrome c peroxidase